MANINRLCAMVLATVGLAVYAGAQSYPPAWNVFAHYAAGDQVQIGGNIYRATHAVAAGTNPTTDYADWQMKEVLASTTLMIGIDQTFPTYEDAWSYIPNAKVADGAYLHLYISTAKGNYSDEEGAPILLDHGSGARIALLGDNPLNVVFSFGGAGMILDTGHAFNTISNISLNGNSEADQRDGIKADLQASIGAISNTIVTGFLNDIHVTQDASVSISSGTVLEQFVDCGALAETGGSLVLNGDLTINQPELSQNGSGIVASLAGIVYIPNGVTISNTYDGIAANANGTVYVSTPEISSCVVGLDATDHGVIICTGAGNVTGSSRHDLEAFTGALINAGQTNYSTSFSNFATDGSYIEP
jgi:hypothetical protein